MVDILAYGLPFIGISLAAIGMFAVHHSTKVLKRKLADQQQFMVHADGGAQIAPAQGYSEVHVSIVRSDAVEA